jgi:hypothetical protein
MAKFNELQFKFNLFLFLFLWSLILRCVRAVGRNARPKRTVGQVFKNSFTGRENAIYWIARAAAILFYGFSLPDLPVHSGWDLPGRSPREPVKHCCRTA